MKTGAAKPRVLASSATPLSDAPKDPTTAELPKGHWETATELAARILAQHLVQPSLGHMLSNRILPEEHFEFMGGTPGGSS